MPGFLDLPLELREKIYRYALVKTRIFVRPFITMKYLMNARRADHYGIPVLAILSLSKQVYQEALPIYLRENTFSIVHVDLLAAASREFPRVLSNLEQIRKIEVVFDSRDYVYLAQFLGEELQIIADAVKELAENDVEDKVLTVDALMKMNDHFHRYKNLIARHLHPQHIDDMKEYLWGRTLTFLRQTFKLSHLYLDLNRCTCVDGCCRLASEVLSWGWCNAWLHGMPREIHIQGASSTEKMAISRILDRQYLDGGMPLAELYGSLRAIDIKALSQYNDVLRDVRGKIRQRNEPGQKGREEDEADEVVVKEDILS